MSSSEQLPSGLNRWVHFDKPNRADFVRDNEIIDQNAMWKQDYDEHGEVAALGGLSSYINQQVLSVTRTDVLQAVYPVGSIYFSTSESNPEFLFGFGAWISWGAGRIPVGVDATQPQYNNAENTGGSNSVTITKTNLPHVRIGVQRDGEHNVVRGSGNGSGTANTGISSNASAYHPNTLSTDYLGDSTPLDITPPYITCYMWKRTS